ncbi:MAG: YigZ family protein, partial [Bacteroidales bacterium]|nr:YigZ family protein [Bacteroidales bacterium]
MVDTYKTIKQQSEGFYSEKGSKFISFAIPVVDEDEVRENLQVIKKKYFDARHHVYAFVIGDRYETFRASDDGEPSNSSGMPVLGQIRSNQLSYIMVVVVRYFGGTKLGIPGLINAYKTAAASAIENAEV